MRFEPVHGIMDIQSNNVVENSHHCYQNALEDLQSEATESLKVLVSHFGEFSQDLVNSLSTKVEETLLESGVKKGIVKRVFSILVEGLQNIRIHGEKDQDGNQVSFLIIAQVGETFKITFGNLLKNRNINNITSRIDKLNQMELPEVKELYMEVLTNGIMSNKGGAGLGFITIAMKAKNKLDYSIEKLDDDLSCFIMSTTLASRNK